MCQMCDCVNVDKHTPLMCEVLSFIILQYITGLSHFYFVVLSVLWGGGSSSLD